MPSSSTATFPFTVPAAVVTGVFAMILITVGMVLPPGKAPGARLELAIGAVGEPPPAGVVQESIDTIRRRLRQLAASDAAVSPAATAGRIAVEFRGDERMEAWRAILTNQARLDFSLVEGEPQASRDLLEQKYGGALPPNLAIVPGDEPGGGAVFYVVDREPAISNRDIASARPTVDELNAPAVALRLTPDGVTKFYAVTRAGVGRRIAILFNDRVQSAPRIEAAINQPDIRITGSFTQSEVTRLALVLRTGRLPAPLTVTDEQPLAAVEGFPIARWLSLAGGVGFGAVAMLFLFGYLSGRSAPPAP